MDNSIRVEYDNNLTKEKDKIFEQKGLSDVELNIFRRFSMWSEENGYWIVKNIYINGQLLMRSNV